MSSVVVADLAHRHSTSTPPNRRTTMTDNDLVRKLADGIRYWTEDPDRCDMEGRENEVASHLAAVIRGMDPDEQPIERFVEWFRNDLVYKAPEVWPDRVSWFLDTLVERYGGAA